MWPKKLSLLTIFISTLLRILRRRATMTFVSIPARSIVLIAALLTSAGATTITVLPADNITQAVAETNTWLTETFGAGTAPDPVNVDIGNLTPGKSKVERLQLITAFHSIYFFMTGVDGNVQIQTADGTSAHVHAGDGGLYFVGINSTTSIGSIQWWSRDGLGLKDFGIPQMPGAAPEPATWLCIAMGLIAITLAFSKQPARSPTKSQEPEQLCPPGWPRSRPAPRDRSTRLQSNWRAIASPH